MNPMFETLVFPQDARILEVGCGYGNWAAWASVQVPQGEVLAVDLDPKMVDWAGQQYPSSVYPNLRFLQADARELQFEAEPFDFAMSNACLHYLEHPGQAFGAMARHLRPGGRLCVTCLGQGNLRDLFKALERVMQDKDWKPYFEGHTKSGSLADARSCEPWLEEAGLVKMQGRLFNETVTFPHREAFRDWFGSNFGFYFEAVPNAFRGQFCEAVIQSYCRRQSNKGPVRVFRVWLQLDAVKRHQ